MPTMSSSVEKLYMFQPGLFACSAKVMALGKDDKGTFVKLSKTIFHPQGGGQPFDVGVLRFGEKHQVNIISVQKEIKEDDADKNNFDIRHYVSPETTELNVGEDVEMLIDQNRRQLNARLHSAGHLIAAVVEKYFGKDWKATGGHHIPKEARVEFTPVNASPVSSAQEVQKCLQEQLPLEIEADSIVNILLDESGRRIQIGGYEAVPCGGTHVERLSALEQIDVREVKIKSKKLRVSYGVGEV